MAPSNDVLEPEADQPTAIARNVRHPGIATTVNELASMKGEALEILDARIQILETARKRAIRMTSPEDWLLFKSPDGRVTGYLQDCGCDRIRDITGIEIFGITEPQRIVADDAKSFMYIIRGSGRSKLTQQVVEDMEGGRQSTDDFCKGKQGSELELSVRKAARANLDGNITRELAGLKSVPLDEMIAAWEGTKKSADNCRKGRGFGSQDERHGASKEGVPDVQPPMCPVCKIPLVYRPGKGDRAPFYGCRQYESHKDQKVFVDAGKWIAEQKAKPSTTVAAPEPAEPTQAAQPETSVSPSPAATKQTRQQQPRREVNAGDIFGREPGAEG